jgi:hypothetical protein
MLMNQRTALVQPHSTEAEMSVLGSMMLDPDAVEKVTEMLQPDDFYHPAHQILYRAMSSMRERNQAIDLLTVQEELRRLGQLEEVGGVPALVNLRGKRADRCERRTLRPHRQGEIDPKTPAARRLRNHPPRGRIGAGGAANR